MVVYTPAVPADNPELVAARGLGVPVVERPAILGMVMEPYEHRVAVSGTHGKTTTTSMISSILASAGMDATVLVGAEVAALGGNARLGGGSIAVAEACEAFGSFLHLHPSMAVITNIDADHLDYYGTIERIEQGFRKFRAPGGCGGLRDRLLGRRARAEGVLRERTAGRELRTDAARPISTR